jgi:TRAP-type uncharacterized transport system fused permease subunit
VPFVFVLDPQGIGLLLTIPKDGSMWDVVWITLKTGAGLIAFAAAAQNWALRKNTVLERVMFTVAGFLLVFPGLIEALSVAAAGFKLPQPGLIGLLIAGVVLIMQKMGSSAPAAPAQT